MQKKEKIMPKWLRLGFMAVSNHVEIITYNKQHQVKTCKAANLGNRNKNKH